MTMRGGNEMRKQKNTQTQVQKMLNDGLSLDELIEAQGGPKPPFDPEKIRRAFSPKDFDGFDEWLYKHRHGI